ncbi:uncharacterized protein LOC114877469 isoform X2 [Osmia bicornis bicornis]|uniref:uncharacterized protein LOC114877469 isoform X2 n=1 Tax=Osmia bicornis bicornis TaxID=1437191 RepID=UPI0010FA370A|nr:uncharacterized protein LOC114877469 isoform X2 [Osmia bicornis bicornis]
MNEFINDIEVNTSGQLLNDSSCNQNDFYSNSCKVDFKRKATQLVIFLIFVLGIFFAILIYCKSCSRTSARYSQNSSHESDCNQRGESENINSLPCNTLYESRDRPPSYSEACSAPPLYTAPFNRISMLEVPPVYPETPKSSDRKAYLENQAFPVINHI